MVIAITASRRAADQAKIIEKLGGIPYISPTVSISIKKNTQKESEEFIKKVILGVDYIIFMTGPSVYSIIKEAERQKILNDFVFSLNKTIVIARGKKPKSALTHHNIKTNITPNQINDYTIEGIKNILLKKEINGKKIAIIWHGSSSKEFVDEMKSKGVNLIQLKLYEYTVDFDQDGVDVLDSMGFKSVYPDENKIQKLILDLIERKIQVITFTSPPSVENLFRYAKLKGLTEKLLNIMNEYTIIVAIGGPTKMAIERNDVDVDVIPETYKLGYMIQALEKYIVKNDSKKNKD